MMTTALYADYEHSWNKHNFKATAGMNSEYYYINNLEGKRYDVVNEKVPSINTATGTSNLKAYSKEWATMGYFARVNYDYDGKYLLEEIFEGTPPHASVAMNVGELFLLFL